MHSYFADWKGFPVAYHGGLMQCLAKAQIWVVGKPKSSVLILKARVGDKTAKVIFEVDRKYIIRILGGANVKVSHLLEKCANYDGKETF